MEYLLAMELRAYIDSQSVSIQPQLEQLLEEFDSDREWPTPMSLLTEFVEINKSGLASASDLLDVYRSYAPLLRQGGTTLLQTLAAHNISLEHVLSGSPLSPDRGPPSVQPSQRSQALPPPLSAHLASDSLFAFSTAVSSSFKEAVCSFRCCTSNFSNSPVWLLAINRFYMDVI